jgi:hypothetical protein
MGVPRKRFLDPLPMSTGMGFPVFGPKNRWFTDIIEDGVLVDRLPAPEVVDEYERMLDCWRQGERAYPVCSATLKDEPTKLDSEKVRVFQAAPVAMSLHIRRYFLPIMRFLCGNPVLSECAVGLNSFSTDWEALIDHAFSYDSEEGVLAWDYSKYDVRMFLLDSQGAPRNWMAYLPKRLLELVFWLISIRDVTRGKPTNGYRVQRKQWQPDK